MSGSGRVSPQRLCLIIVACHLGTEIIVASPKSYRNDPRQSGTPQSISPARAKAKDAVIAYTARLLLMLKSLRLKTFVLNLHSSERSSSSYARRRLSSVCARRQADKNRMAGPYSGTRLKQKKDIRVDYIISVSSSAKSKR